MQHLIARASKQRGAQLDREQPAGIQCFGSGMGGARTVGRAIGQLVRTLRVIHRHRRQPHQRTIPSRARIGAAAEGRAAIQIALQRLAHGRTDIEAGTGTAELTVLVPIAIAVHLIGRVEALPMQQAMRQAQGHRGVVGPLPGPQGKRAAAVRVVDRREAARRAEFERGA